MGGDEPAQAGIAVDGHDAGDHLDAGCSRPKGEAHFGSPDKDPAVRLRVLEDAGRLSVPFTTGLLVGIGETLAERAETIFALRAIARRYGALQEVIVQNFRAKPDTAMRHADDLALDEYRAAIAVTRIVLGPQGAGAGPAEPGRPRPSAARCSTPASTTGAASPRSPPTTSTPNAPGPPSSGCARSPRSAGSSCAPGSPCTPSTCARASRGSTPGSPPTSPPSPTTTASRAPAYDPKGLPWQEPDGGFAPVGRHRPHRPARRIDTDGRTNDRRGDFDAVYGDWDVVRAPRRSHGGGRVRAPHAAGGRPPHRTARADPATWMPQRPPRSEDERERSADGRDRERTAEAAALALGCGE